VSISSAHAVISREHCFNIYKFVCNNSYRRHLKVSHFRQLVDAVEAEEANETRRVQLLDSCLLSSTYNHILEGLNLERLAAREHLRRLQHDNEVILIQQVKLVGLLW
jgi:hypothetical protein